VPSVHNNENVKTAFYSPPTLLQIHHSQSTIMIFSAEKTFKNSYCIYYIQCTVFTTSVISLLYEKKWKHSVIVGMTSMLILQTNQYS